MLDAFVGSCGSQKCLDLAKKLQECSSPLSPYSTSNGGYRVVELIVLNGNGYSIVPVMVAPNGAISILPPPVCSEFWLYWDYENFPYTPTASLNWYMTSVVFGDGVTDARGQVNADFIVTTNGVPAFTPAANAWMAANGITASLITQVSPSGDGGIILRFQSPRDIVRINGVNVRTPTDAPIRLALQRTCEAPGFFTRKSVTLPVAGGIVIHEIGGYDTGNLPALGPDGLINPSLVQVCEANGLGTPQVETYSAGTRISLRPAMPRMTSHPNLVTNAGTFAFA